MGTIRIVGSEEGEWVETTPLRKYLAPVGDATEVTFRSRSHHTAHDDEPYLTEIEVSPNSEILPHGHDFPEIMYVLEGEIVMGSRVIGPGGSVLVGGATLYGYRTGPDGARYLLFKPHADRSIIEKHEFGRS